MFPALTTATWCWLDSQPQWLNCHNVSRTLQRLIFDLPKFSHVTPILRELHWLPVAAHIQFKMMVLVFKAINGTAPFYLQKLVRPHASARALRSTTSAGWLVPPSLRANKAHSAKFRLFSVLTPQWWNEPVNRPMSGQRNHSPSSAKDSRLICSDFTSTPHSMTPSQIVCYCLLYRRLYVVRNVLIVSFFGLQMWIFTLFLCCPYTVWSALVVSLSTRLRGVCWYHVFSKATQVSPSELQDVFQETSSNIFQINANGKEPTYQQNRVCVCVCVCVRVRVCVLPNTLNPCMTSDICMIYYCHIICIHFNMDKIWWEVISTCVCLWVHYVISVLYSLIVPPVVTLEKNLQSLGTSRDTAELRQSLWVTHTHRLLNVTECNYSLLQYISERNIPFLYHYSYIYSCSYFKAKLK